MLNADRNTVIAETRDPVREVRIAAGGIPSGTSLSVSGNQVVLTGKPDKKGYTVATLKITTEKNETITKPVGCLVAQAQTFCLRERRYHRNCVRYDRAELQLFPLHTFLVRFEPAESKDFVDEAEQVISAGASVRASHHVTGIDVHVIEQRSEKGDQQRDDKDGHTDDEHRGLEKIS
jgi:hypothetical protein